MRWCAIPTAFSPSRATLCLRNPLVMSMHTLTLMSATQPGVPVMQLGQPQPTSADLCMLTA